MTVPAVLLGDEFAPLWRHVSAKLEDRGLDDRRPIPLPRGLPEVVFARLGDVLRVRYPTTRRRLDLEALDRGLGRYGSDLMALLEAAGCAPTGRQEARLADEGRRRSRDGALRRAAEEAFGTDPWVEAWCSSVRGTVPTADDADRAVAEVRRVLDCAADGVRSRAEVAGVVFGDTKALDGGDRRRRVRAAIAHRACGPTRDDAELWAASGLPGDLISSLVPTWALPLLGAAGVAAAVRAMTQVGQPVPPDRPHGAGPADIPPGRYHGLQRREPPPGGGSRATWHRAADDLHPG